MLPLLRKMLYAKLSLSVGLNTDYCFEQDALFALCHRHAFMYDIISDGQYLYAVLGNNVGDSLSIVRYNLPRPCEHTSERADPFLLMPHGWQLHIPYGNVFDLKMDFIAKEIRIFLCNEKEVPFQRLEKGWKLIIRNIQDTNIKIDARKLNRFEYRSEKSYLNPIYQVPPQNIGLCHFIPSKAEFDHPLVQRATQLYQMKGIPRDQSLHFIFQEKNHERYRFHSFLQQKGV